MKTRIISGLVMGIVVIAVLLLGFYVSGWFIIGFVAALAALAMYELLYTVLKIKNKAAVAAAAVYAVLSVIILCSDIYNIPVSLYSYNAEAEQFKAFISLTVLYFIFAAAVILIRYKDFTLEQIAVFCAFPVVYSYAFSSLTNIINHKNAVFYILLLFNFSSVCDMGAYFIGSACGKHKLCPEISPKKTVEGAAGGIVCSLVISIVLALCFKANVWVVLAVTVPFCILGMMGDLFASVIKRHTGVKDYGNLIPGHGGVLDRLDSMLFMAPLFYILITAGTFA